MSYKIPCTECGVMVLPSTAERIGGFCMSCKNGTRRNIEKVQECCKREGELNKTYPFHELCRELVVKVYKQEALSDDEKLYYSVNTLGGEVYNGGFVQYFENSSGEHYRDAELGIFLLEKTNSLRLSIPC
ncbi:DMP19 family protein [Halomonas sp. NyZ770]|uniref:DMP19 family protein n=1 Tax=Halomonas sp. NyZ770 TaxID=2883106 RepID=UPI001D09C1EA|nr:DUF4375 domain-containing protein [Halomonas sp. NyZ770]UDM05757.1 DMP19 family protein [Halomonas sp. NyZ770]